MLNKVVITGIVTSLIVYSFSSTVFVAADSVNPGVYSKDSAPYGIPYGKWREYDPEDTIRFYSLRLHEAGMIKSSPQKVLAQGTDWRFFSELRKELKG